MPSSAQNVMRFGNFYYRTALLMKDSRPEALSLLHPDEISFIEGLRVGSDAEAAYRHHLNGNINEFFEVRQHIMALLQVWDAIIDEKNRHDAGGRPRQTKLFMKAFLVCMKLVPGRVNIGSLGLDSQDSGLSPLGLSPLPSQEEVTTESSVEGVEGVELVQSSPSTSDVFFTSSDEDGYETSSCFSEISGLQSGLEYDPTQGQSGYELDLNSSDFDNFTVGLGIHGGDYLGSGYVNTHSGQESQSSNRKRTHTEAWDEEDQDTETSRTRRTKRRLN